MTNWQKVGLNSAFASYLGVMMIILLMAYQVIPIITSIRASVEELEKRVNTKMELILELEKKVEEQKKLIDQMKK